MIPVGRFARGPAPGPGAILALPLVGAVLGAVAGVAGMVAARVFPHAFAAAVALATVVVLTGAIHLDGFLDGCDAFFASASPERRLEILKDPRHGTFAVAGMFVAGVLWFAALAAVAAPAYPAILAFAGALARAAVLPAALAFPHARAGQPIRTFAKPQLPALAAALFATALGAAAYALAPRFVAVVPAAFLGAWLIARGVANRLGGVLVGDAHGFAIVILEIAILATFAAGTAAGGG